MSELVRTDLNGEVHAAFKVKPQPLNGQAKTEQTTLLPSLNVIEGGISDGRTRVRNPNVELSEFPPLISDEDSFFTFHPHFVPFQHSPKALGQMLDELDHQRRKPAENIVYIRDVAGTRPEYHSNGSERTELLRDAIYNVGIYNSGDGYNVNIHDAEAYPVYEKAREFLKSGSVQVLLPFASEAGSVGKIIRYAQGRVGSENVLAIDAQTDAAAGIEAQETEVTVLKQHEILACVDWKRLKGLGIVPHEFPDPPKGAKGLTIYAGLLALEAQGKLTSDTILALHDTDVVNPGPADANSQGVPGEYSALDYLAIPFAFPVSEDTQINGTYILRTGEGRNNEPWVHTFNVIARATQQLEDPTWHRYATMLTTIGWPLSGERTITGSMEKDGKEIPLIRSLAIPSKMSIETYFNLALTGIDVTTGERHIAQIANPDPKIENRPSYRDREFSIVDSVAMFGYDVFQHAQSIGKFPHEWNLEDVAAFNKLYSHQTIQVSIPSRTDHHGNKLVDVNPDYLLPSMDDLRKLDNKHGFIVDWSKIQTLAKSAATK